MDGAFPALAGDGGLGEPLGRPDAGAVHARAGDADDDHVLPFQLRFPHEPRQGPQVAPLGDDGEFPLPAHFLLRPGEVEGEVVDAGGGEDELGGFVRRSNDAGDRRPRPPAGNIADDRGHLSFSEEPRCLVPDGGGDAGVAGVVHQRDRVEFLCRVGHDKNLELTRIFRIFRIKNKIFFLMLILNILFILVKWICTPL